MGAALGIQRVRPTAVAREALQHVLARGHWEQGKYIRVRVCVVPFKYIASGSRATGRGLLGPRGVLLTCITSLVFDSVCTVRTVDLKRCKS